MQRKLRLGVLISGSGTNLQAIIDRIRSGDLDAEIVVVISNREGVKGLERAQNAGIPTEVVLERDQLERDKQILHHLHSYCAELVVMAGYMRLLGTTVLNAYPNKVVNLHPALLPSFAGAHGIQDAFDYGVKQTGVTVHFANEVFDEGPIIAQEVVTVREDDTVETLEERIHVVEHQLLPRVLQLYAEGRVKAEGRKVRIASD